MRIRIRRNRTQDVSRPASWGERAAQFSFAAAFGREKLSQAVRRQVTFARFGKLMFPALFRV
jgi:hypothetical protein